MLSNNEFWVWLDWIMVKDRSSLLQAKGAAEIKAVGDQCQAGV